jgi:hypothetical protein
MIVRVNRPVSLKEKVKRVAAFDRRLDAELAFGDGGRLAVEKLKRCSRVGGKVGR